RETCRQGISDMTVLDDFYKGNIRALSKVISCVENQAEDYQKLLGTLYLRAGHTLRIGVTGPPGAGKSTLVNCLAREYLKQGKKVGVIAVDPTSPFTGGALLGDRVRLSEFPADGSFYFRSMATRGASGGLAATTDNVSVVYNSFGFDITLIETVGVGQVELDIINTCDVVVVALVPESGDSVQTMKAGLMEIADIFCVNKADREGSDRLVTELRQALDSRKKVEGRWRIPVIPTVAIRAEKIDKLLTKIEDFLKFRKDNGQFEQHRKNQLKKKVHNILTTRVNRLVSEKLGHVTNFEEIIEDIYRGKGDPYSVAEDLFSKINR
ncbi:MAG: methylmalonyl Co-A mutase-associated GTPase MeaB, partial [Candidatus Zixiibacteriota bacterium]